MKNLFRFVSVLLVVTIAFGLTTYSQTFNKRGEPPTQQLFKSLIPPTPENAFHIANVDYGPLSGTPEQMARQYLQAQSARFKMKSNLNDIELAYVQESPAGYHVNFTQTYEGIPIHQADLVVSIDRKNKVEFFASNYKSNFTPPPTTNPQLSSTEALQVARNFLGVTGELMGDQSSTLMINIRDNAARLAYRVVIPAFQPRGDWEVFVDAITGEVISVLDMTVYRRASQIQQKKPDYPGVIKTLPTIPVRPAIQELVNQVSTSRLTQTIERLQALKPRSPVTAAGRDSLARTRDWIIAQLQSYGYTDIFQHHFTYSGYTLQNIIATKTGYRFPDTMVILGAHYDAVNVSPGADDNGSGVALTLEVARLLAKSNFEYTIKFIFFSAEEHNLAGSVAYVQQVAIPGNHRIRVMINADMIGYSGGSDTIKVERDTDNSPPGNNAASAAFTDTLAALTQLYSTLKAKITSAYGSDYMSFEDAGYVISGFFENIMNPYYHTNRDSLVHLDPNYYTQVTKAAVAGVVHFSRISTGSGFVFDPDPLTTALATYGQTGFVDGDDADTPQLTAQRFLRPLPDLTFSGGVYNLRNQNVQVIDWDTPNKPIPTAAHPDSFRFTRFNDNFEAVMCYYHVDLSQRWIQSLGFTNIQNNPANPIGADPHGFNGADNSAYYPSTNRMTFGEGGVDDAEDADVILHEYGHGIQHSSKPGWSGSGQQGALGEGFGDFWAESYSRSLNFWQPHHAPYFWVFDWDGHNPFWAGRVLNYTPLYPGGLTGAIHTDGQMWSTDLMKIWNETGREVIDKCVLQSHFYLPASGATMTMNAQAVIQANRNLYGGAHVPIMVYHFGQRGYINPNDYVPSIVHTPRGDSENPNGPYPVTALVYAGGSPLDTNRIMVYWGRHGAINDSVQMVRTSNPNEWTANIPGHGDSATYRYYIYARDEAGGFATHPTNAPTNFHQFYVGQDITPPVITHTPLRNQPLLRWPPTVKATITDNLGIDSAWVEFTRLRGPLNGQFRLLNTSGNTYEGIFNLDVSQVEVGDIIQYKIFAKDISGLGNITTHPAVGMHSFEIISTKGIVLVVDDDGTAKYGTVESEKGVEYIDPALKGVTGRLIQRTLTEAGYIVDTASFAIHDPSVYPNYDIVVWTGGIRTSTMFGDLAKRNALINRVNLGGKVWIEGGEVGYVYRWLSTGELHPAFRRAVLHDSNWVSDVTTSNLVITQPAHPIFNVPNSITAPIAFTGTGWGVRDAMRLIPGDAGAYKVAGWSAYAAQGPDTCALIIYDNNPNPLSAQIVFFPFALAAITDTMVAKRLIENTAEYLMTPEPPPQGGLSGVVSLEGTTDWSGVKVKIQGLTVSYLDSMITASDGVYIDSGLYAGTYRVTVSKPGFVPFPLSRDTVVGTTLVTGFNFALNQLLPTTVSGTVTLAGQTDHSGVTVSIVGQGLSTVTNAAGEYTITGLYPGNITVRATKAGFRTVSKDTVIANGQSIVVNFNLPVEAILVYETFETVPVDGIPTGWTRIDVNGDGNTWKTVADATYNITPGGGKGIKYTYHLSNAANDWLITYPLVMEGGVPHRVTFWYRTNSSAYVEKIEVMWGTSPTAAALTNLVWRKEDITNTVFAKAEATLVVPTTGTYYVGWRVYSIANQFNPGLDDIKIEVVPPKDIGVTKLWVPLASKVGRSFQNPTEEEIARINEAEMLEAQLAGKSPGSGYIPWEQPNPQLEEGFELSKTDSVVILAEVMNFGTEAQSTFNVQWRVGTIGQTPLPYTETLQPGAKDTVELVWRTPSVGLHTVVAWTDLADDGDRSNDTARTTINVSPPGIILSESFEAGTTLPPGWSTAVVTTGTTPPAWTIITGTGTNPAAPPYHGTNQARFNSYSASSGTQARLTTKRLALPPGGSRMTFWMYHDPGYSTSWDSITVQVTTGDSITGPWTRLAKFNRYEPTAGWRKDSVDLLAFGGQPRVFLSFLATSRYGNNMYIDLVEVYPYTVSDFVTVTSPNGGEVWLQGTQQTISWNSYGVSTVNIEYTTNNGTSWLPVASGVPAKNIAEESLEDVFVDKDVNKGSYLWTVPNTPSDLCRVRVTSSTNPALTDMSDGTFRIVTVLPSGWTIRTPAPDAISRPHAAFVRIGGVGHVFVIGGGAPVSTNRRYNTETDSWSSAAAIPTASATGAATTVKNMVYSIGGNTTGASFRYDPVANSWTSIAAVPTPFYDFGLVTWNDSLIYAIGGDNGTFTAPSGASNVVRYYNPTTNTWTSATSLPVAIAKVGAGIIGNTIIIAGGWDGSTTVSTAYRGEINPANPAQITWTAIASYPAGATARVAGAGLTNGNGVVFTGGLIGGSTPTGNTYLYSLTTNSWSTLPSMPTARGNMSSQLANNGVDYMWAMCGYTTVAVNNNERFYMEPLAPPSPHVTVVSPNGGEWWQVGQQYNIVWSQYGQTTVKLEYSTNNGLSWILITSSTPAKTDEFVPKLALKSYENSEDGLNKGSYLWTVPNTPTTSALVRVTSNDNPSLFDVSNSVFTISTVPPPPPPGWTVQTSGITTALQSVKAVSGTVAWAAGNAGRVLRTTNGGTTWTAVTNPSTLDNHNIEAIDANTAFVCANGTDDARIYRTTNGGSTWTLVYQSTAAGAFVNFVKMFDANNGYMQGDPIGSPLKYVLLRTTNGGTTWTPAADLAPAASSEWGWNNSHHWVGSTRGWFGTNNNRIYYTTNNGATWISGSTPLLESPSIFFKDALLGLAGTNAANNATPTIARSTNGGAAWTNITSPVTARVYGMSGTGDKVWATSGANIVTTTNFGTSWSTSYTGTGTWYHLSFVKAGSAIHGWAVNSNGGIVKYYEYEAPTVGSISGVKFNDLDGDGVKDVGEPGLANWKIRLSGTVIDSILTDGNGMYMFNELPAGDYTVSEELKTGWIQTFPSGGIYNITLATGENVTGKDFGNFRPGTISGVKFEDINGDSVRNLGEPGLSGWKIYLSKEGYIDSVLTDGSGAFMFNGLPAGTYTLSEQMQTGWVQTKPSTGSYTIVIAGNDVTGREFGNFRLGSITGMKWKDNDGDGIKDEDEPPLRNWTIQIAGLRSAPRNTVTNEFGAYSFFDVFADVYTISEVTQPGFTQTYPPAPGTHTVIMRSGLDTVGLDFGNFYPDTAKFRTFTADSLAYAKDTKGKFGKAVKKKADKVFFKFNLVAPATSNLLFLEFSMNVTGVITKGKTKLDTLATFSGKKPAGITLPVVAGDEIQIDGIGMKGKQVKVKYAWGNVRRNLVTSFKLNEPGLPMPNLVNLVNELYQQGAFDDTRGLLVGVPLTGAIAQRYGWAQIGAAKDVFKSLYEKGKVHSETARMFDIYGGSPFIGMKKVVPPSKHDNALFAELLALKVNIISSAAGKTPVGFGDLIYDDGVSGPFRGKNIIQIAAMADSFVTFGISSAFVSADSFYNVIKRLNSAFAGPLDTVSFANKLVFKGYRPLSDVAYLKPDIGGRAATRIVLDDKPTVEEPAAFALYQNYPNPFNPTTSISFELPDEAVVTLKVYDILGREVATLLQGELLDEGRHSVDFSAQHLANGVYFYRLTVDVNNAEFDDEGAAVTTYQSVKKLLLMK